MSGQGFVSRLLDDAVAHTTFIGKLSWIVLVLLRIAMPCFLANSVFGDLAGFACRTSNDQFGCTRRCKGEFFPVSPVRIWTVQLAFVTALTLIYLGHVMHVTRKEKRLREQLASPAPPRGTYENGHVKIKGKLLFTYLTTLLLTILIEVLSIYAQYRLYRGLPQRGEDDYYLELFKVDSMYLCNENRGDFHPCSQPVECTMPRGTEKTWTIRYMVGVACFSVFLNVIEMLYLICKMKCCFRSCKRRNDPREEVLVEEEVLEEEEEDSQSGCNAPSYATAMLQDNNVIVEMENMPGQSSSGGLDGDDGAAAALTSLTKRTSPKTAKHPAPQPLKN